PHLRAERSRKQRFEVTFHPAVPALSGDVAKEPRSEALVTVRGGRWSATGGPAALGGAGIQRLGRLGQVDDQRQNLRTLEAGRAETGDELRPGVAAVGGLVNGSALSTGIDHRESGPRVDGERLHPASRLAWQADDLVPVDRGPGRPVPLEHAAGNIGFL